MKIDRKRSIPISMQIEKWLEEKIASGKYRVNEMIPSESKLAALLKVSRPTVKRAVSSLEKKDVLICHPCIGSFVKKRPRLKSVLPSIGVILPNISDPFFYQLVKDLEKVLQEVSYSMVLAGTNNDHKKELDQLRNLLYHDGIRGYLISSISISMKRLRIPVVFMSLKPDDIEADFISIDNRYGVHQLIDYLESLGHRKIGYIRGKLYYKRDIRRESYEKALKAHGLKLNPEWIRESQLRDEKGGREAMEKMLEGKDLPTAIFAESDTTAIGAMQIIKERGIKVPRDISIAGFDNIHASAHLEVPLTTIDYPTEEMAKKAVEILIEKISNPKAIQPLQEIIIKPKLIIRSSCTRLSWTP